MSYSIAKAEVIHYARCLAAELGPCNINVNCVAPALICTSRAIVDGRKGKVAEELIKQIPLGRMDYPKDAAKVVEFLSH